MKKSDIYEIAIKILGLYLTIRVLDQLKELVTYITYFSEFNNPEVIGVFDQTSIIALSVFNFLLVLFFAWLFIFKTRKITSLICKEDDYLESAKLFTDKKTIIEIALIIFGLITVIWTIPEFGVKLQGYIVLLLNDFAGNMNDKSFLYLEGLKIVLGLIAILYAKSIATSLSKDKTEVEEK